MAFAAWLIWSGALISVFGVSGLLGCAVYGLRLRRLALDEATMRARLGRALVWHLLALAFGVLGLMLVILGLFLR